MDLEKHLVVDGDGNEFLVYNGSKRQIWRDHFVMELPVFAAIAAANGQQTQQMQIPADSDFYWQIGAMQYDLALAAFTISTAPMPNMSILITDSGSGRQLANASIPVTNLFGTLYRPMRLPFCKLFTANAVISATVTNFDAASATGNLRLSFIGQKIFYLS